ncbi:MAG: response regulator, partial [Desulfobacteraceae bacterium]|nr:response regulator [Desulfobacteraceae bacterium]
TKRSTRDGQILDVSMSVASIYDDEEHNIGNVVIVRDETQRQKMEDDLRKTKDEYIQLFNASVDAIVRYDAQGFVQYLNPAFTQLFGWTFEELKGKRVDFVPEEVLEDTLELVNKMKLRESISNFPTLRLTKDGRKINVALSTASIADEEGNNIGNVVIFRDETERKKAEIALQKAISEKAANQLKSKFLANMSHEIRTPMNGIMGMAGLMMDTSLDDDQLDYMKIIRSSSDALLSIINDILDFSKIEAGKMDMEMLDFDLRRSLDEIINIPAVASREKGLELCYEINPEVPALIVGDPGRLRQIIINLLNNAIKFTSEGEIVLRVSLKEESDTHVLLHFIVKDTGIGISKKDISGLFQTFHQVDTSTTRKYGGTGLGLAICKQIVGLMKGEIGAESKLGKGTQFWFTASFKKQDQAEEKVCLGLDEIKDKRVLVVDDNKTNLKILIKYIENWGLICDSAWNAEMAITMINAAKKYDAQYDVLISDYNMPKMDGGELGRHIKTDPDTKDMIMIILSSRGIRGDAAKMKEIGFSGYLTKPVSRRDLLDCIIMSLSPEQDSDIKKKDIVTRYKISDDKKKNFRVLLAEDNIVNQKLALKLIEKWGASADAVANGLEAIESLKLMPYDLVLMDVQMPEMGGLEATVEIRSPQSNVMNSKVPIVAMTARAMKGDKQMCLDAGMDDYITKPVNPDKLYELLNDYLEKLK